MTNSTLSIWRALLVGIASACCAAAINVGIYFLARAMGWIPEDYVIAQSGQPFNQGPVFFSSIVFAIPAAIIYFFLVKRTRNAERNFIWFGVIWLVISFVTPFTLPDPSIAMKVSLELMHVVAGLFIIFGLIRFAR